MSFEKVRILLVVALGIFISYFLFSDKKIIVEPKEKEKISVEVVKAQRGSLVETFETVGVLVAEKKVDILAGVPGRIANLAVKAGSHVKENQLLAELTPQSRIYSPFDGVLADWKVSPGQNVIAGTLLTEVIDFDTLSIEYKLPEQYLSKVKKQQKIEVKLKAIPNSKIFANLEFISPTVDRGSLTVLLRAYIDNADYKLSPGMSCKIKHYLGVKNNAILIPEQALNFTIDGTEVFVVEDGKIVRKEVKTGFREKDKIEIKKGLNVGDVVVTVHTASIREGVEVAYEGV